MLIDCGTELENLEAVHYGIYIIEYYLENTTSKDWSANELVSLYYNLSNGYGTKSLLHQKNNDLILMKEALQQQKHYLQLALLKKENIEPDLLASVIINYANLLDRLGRIVEAIDHYYDCLAITPNHAVAMGNCGFALGRLRLFDISKKRNYKLLYESWRLLSKAIQLQEVVTEESGYKALLGYRKYLEELEHTVSKLYPNGVEDLKDLSINPDTVDTSWKPSSIIEKIQKDRLLLTTNPFLWDCQSDYKDEIVFEVILVPASGDGNILFQRLCHTFNNIKEDFATARYYYYQSQSENLELVEVSSITTYINTLDYADFGIKSGLLKSSLRLSADLLDKCAVFLNLYLELENEEDRVTFSNFWYKNLKYKKNEENKGLHPKVEKLLNSNRFFAALYDIQRDLYEGKYPFPYKTLRNEATHKRLVLSWYGSLDEEIKSYSLREFREITYSLLRMVKAAIIYIVGIVTLEETEKESEYKRNLTEHLVAKNVFFFDTGIGISDQLSSSDNKR